jgi:hypothetical protein
VQLAPAAACGRDFAVRVKADLARSRRQRLERRLGLLLAAIAEHEPTADAADRERERGLVTRHSRRRRSGGAHRPGDEPVVVRAHELRVPAGGDVAGERHRLRRLVDREHGAHDGGLRAALLAYGQRESERGRGQSGSEVAEVFLVERERRFAVELVEHVAGRPGHLALRTERVPAALRAGADLERAAKGDRDHVAGSRLAIDQHPRPGEAVAVGRQAADDGRVPGKRIVQSADEFGAVDRQSLGKDEDEARPRRGQCPAEAGARRSRVADGVDRRGGDGQVGPGEARDGDDQRAVGDRVAVDFTGARAADDGAAREGRSELGQRIAVLSVFRRAKGDHERASGVEPRRQLARPAGP